MNKTNLLGVLCAALVAGMSSAQAAPDKVLTPPARNQTAPSDLPQQALSASDAQAPAAPALEPETALEAAILDRAARCERRKVALDRPLLRDMLRLEEASNVPPLLRGMVLTAACYESGFNPGSEGDHRFSKTGKAVAIGILQQWPWWEYGKYGPKINRRDPRQASAAWLVHVAKQVPGVQRRCDFGATQTELIWRTAWVTAVRAPAKKPRCTQAAKHWKLFLEWRKSWEHLLRQNTV